MNGEPQWRIWWRRGFAAFLGLALLIGLYVSYRPGGFRAEPEVASDDTTEPAEDENGDEPPPSEAATDDAGDAEEEVDPDAMTEAEAEAFIEDARDPEKTSVQVLDAGGGPTATAAAAEAL